MAGFKIIYEGDYKKNAILAIESICPICGKNKAKIEKETVPDEEAKMKLPIKVRYDAKYQFRYTCSNTECQARWRGNIYDEHYNMVDDKE